MAIFLTTARLVLADPEGTDLPEVIALHADPRVMRHIQLPPQTPAEAEHTFRTKIEVRRAGGLGHWIARRRGTGEFLGWFVLKPEDDDPAVVELGYRLRPEAWGQGLASEGAIALVAKAFREHGVRLITANTMTVNTGSRRVMEKAGLRYVRTYFQEWEGEDLEGGELGDVEYQLSRADWQTRANPTTRA